MKTILILVISLISVHLAQAQNTYILEGTINADTGTMVLVCIGTPSLYPGNIGDITTPVKNGKFMFRGTVNNPLAYTIGHKENGKWDYISGIFFIEKGAQHITCNIDSIRLIPAIENRTTIELRSQYSAALAPIYAAYEVLNSRKDSLQRAYLKHIPSDVTAKIEAEKSNLKVQMDNAFMGYARQHPNSYVILWKIADRMSNGYKPV